MGDVLARLMRWMETSDIDDADVVLRDAITEIAGLRARLDERRRMLTLTDAEREAISRVYDLLCDRSRELQSATRLDEARPLTQWAKTLQGLWERLSGSAAISGAGKSAPAANTPPTLTDAEQEAIRRAIDLQQDRAAEMHSRSWTAAAIDEDCDTLRGMLERQAEGER